jgi:hypothetical protein
MPGKHGQSFDIEVDGKVIGHCSLTEDGLWRATSYRNGGNIGSYLRPTEARAAVLEASTRRITHTTTPRAAANR